MLVILLITTVLTLWFINKYISHRKLAKNLDIFPQYKGLPLIGVAYKFYDVNTALQVGLKLFRECGSSHVVYIAHVPHLIVCDPDLAEVVLGSNVLIEKNSMYDMLRTWMGDGLLTSTGNKWKSHRKVLTPSFHYTILEEFVQVFDKASKVFVQKLEHEVDTNSTSFDIYQYCTLCTLDIICETAMGTVINAQENPNLEFAQSVKEICHIMFLRSVTPLRIGWLYCLTKYYRAELKAIKVLREFSNTIIANRRKVLESKGTLDIVDDFGQKRKHSFLDVLLQATVNNRKLTDEEIRNEVDTFMFEGHDTTAVALGFAIYLLSKHQDVQQRVYEEILSVMGSDKHKSVTMEELQQLKYTEMMIKEALRLYPSVACFGRCLSKDVPYKNGVIPKGVEVVFNTYNMHRNVDVFPEPEKFDPERFSPENSSKRHPYAYVPFSAGPRNCIGQKFAMLELKSTLTKLLRYFVVLPASPDHAVQVTSQVTIQSANGIRISLKRR